MAVNQSRSSNGELAEGATDGRYKKIVQDRGGSVDPATWASRRDLVAGHFGIHEAARKEVGDGSAAVTTPDFVGAGQAVVGGGAMAG